MRTFKIVLAVAFTLAACQPAFGTETIEGKTAAKMKSDLVIESGPFKPFIGFDYGWTTPSFEDVDESFAPLGMAELKVGYVSDDILQHDLISFDQHYAFLSFMNANLSSSGGAAEDEIGSEMTRFGVGNRRGYGYGGSGLKFEMYNQDAMHWTQLKPVEYDFMSEGAQGIFDRYGTTYRFGTLSEAGLRFHLSSSLALNAGYEGAVILPRTVFWPWLGSIAIYSVAQGGLDTFSAKIIEASPKAGPVIAWLLKTGVSAGYYYLLKDDMNWPFNYETPVMVGSFKVGANFKF